jgi:hypothetical protein
MSLSPANFEDEVYSPDVMNDQTLEALLNRIGNKIADAVKNQSSASLPDSAPVKADQFTRGQMIFGIVVGSFAILTSLGACLNYIIGNAVISGLAETRTDLTIATEQSKGMRKDVDRLLDKQSRAILSDPSLATSQPQEIAEAAKRAKVRDIPLDAAGLSRLAEPLLRNGDLTPAKWDALTELANLRSFRNTTLQEAKLYITQFIKPGQVLVNFIPPGEWAEVEWSTVTLDGIKDGPTALLDLHGNPLTVLGNTLFKGAHII